MYWLRVKLRDKLKGQREDKGLRMMQVRPQSQFMINGMNLVHIVVMMRMIILWEKMNLNKLLIGKLSGPVMV